MVKKKKEAKKEELREHILSEQEMSELAKANVKKDMTDGDIFKMVRNLEIDGVDQGFKLINSSEFYWVLMESRDKIPDK